MVVMSFQMLFARLLHKLEIEGGVPGVVKSVDCVIYDFEDDAATNHFAVRIKSIKKRETLSLLSALGQPAQPVAVKHVLPFGLVFDPAA